MEHLSVEFLVSLFSKPRISKFLDETDSPHHLLNKYHRNIILSEAMIPVLHYLEILLRNQIDKVLRKHFGEEWLLSLPLKLMISYKDIKKISEIINKIKRENRSACLHDNILSQMTFGFWCSFFNKKYDPILWHRKDSFKTAFPYLPKSKRRRVFIERKLLNIKIIRNRIAHHEPVWNHEVSIDEVHKNCCEIIKFISPEALSLLSTIDRFPYVLEKTIDLDSNERRLVINL